MHCNSWIGLLLPPLHGVIPDLQLPGSIREAQNIDLILFCARAWHSTWRQLLPFYVTTTLDLHMMIIFQFDCIVQGGCEVLWIFNFHAGILRLWPILPGAKNFKRLCEHCHFLHGTQMLTLMWLYGSAMFGN